MSAMPRAHEIPRPNFLARYLALLGIIELVAACSPVTPSPIALEVEAPGSIEPGATPSSLITLEVLHTNDNRGAPEPYWEPFV